MPPDGSGDAPAACPWLGRPESPWRERRFITQCLAGLLRSRLVGPVGVAAQPGLDWTIVLAEAQQHGVGPLLVVALGARPQTCPEAIWQSLEEQSQRTARRNGLAMVSLSRLLTRFAEANLAPPILLKGAALLHTVYPRLAWRPMQDLDLLVAPEQRREVISLLEAQGYRQDRPAAPSPWHDTVLAEGQPSMHFVSGQGASSLRLECHLTLREWPEASFHDLSEHSRSLGTEAAPGRVLDAPRELLFLLLHLSEHQRPEVGGAGGLLWWFDIAVWAQQGEGQWDPFARLLDNLPAPRQAKAREILASVRTLLGAAIPCSLAGPLAAAQLEQQCRGLWAAPSRPSPDVRWLADLCRDSPRLRSPAAKARFVAGYLAPPPAYLRQQYGLTGTGALARWYAARPLALAVKLARVIVRR